MSDSHETLRDEQFVGKLVAEVEAGHPFVMSSVLATRGSMPRHASARMVLLADGSFIGTIGGGRIEMMAQERSQKVMSGERGNSIEWLTHAKTKMACGGDALVSVRHSFPAKQELHILKDEILGCLKEGKPFLLEEDWSDPADVKITTVELDELPADDKRASADVPVWDETTKLYSEPMGADPKAFIFGAGHVGHALTPVLASVGFKVIIMDDRPDLSKPEDFPQAEKVLVGDFKKLNDYVHITPRDYVVVLTHGHKGDIDVLEQALKNHPAYAGCIGSRSKAAFARQTLIERGCDPTDVQNIHLPIGEDILAVTPSEIAISIAAQMIECRAEYRPDYSHQHIKN